jgi:hypothetical protein
MKKHKTSFFRRMRFEKKTPNTICVGAKSLFTVQCALRKRKNGWSSLAQALPCRFKWYNLSPFGHPRRIFILYIHYILEK